MGKAIRSIESLPLLKKLDRPIFRAKNLDQFRKFIEKEIKV
jgi:hypothetical protein